MIRRRSHSIALYLAAALFLAGGAAVPVSAQEARYGRNAVEIGAFGGLLDVDAPDRAGFAVDRDPVFGGRLGYTLGNGIFLLAEGAWSGQTLQTLTGDTDLDVLRLGGQLGYALQAARSVQLLFSAGAGLIRWTPEGLESETDLAVTGGAGLRLFFGPAVALRLDVRDHYVPDAMGETAARLSVLSPAPGGVPAEDEATHNVEVTAGLSLFIGGERDRDGDGVRDDEDACPETPDGVGVDGTGCPLDGDRDGVTDRMDRCPDTPVGLVVGDDGCRIDTDGDGVPDGVDGCSDTPEGATVDPQGCPTDTDGDGVLDGLDACPDTPEGATTDPRGCPADADGDGVADGRDACPGTPAGRPVDADGCSEIEAGLEAGRLVLEDIHFESGKAEIRPDSRTILDEVGRALADRSGLRVEIQGHTDAVGSAETNRALSERRAETVRAHLLAAFPEIGPERLAVRGFGESRPVAGNDTEEGRERNRRVEFVVLDGDG